MDLARELKKLWNMKEKIIPIGIWCFWYSHQRIIKGSRGLGGWKTKGDHPNYYITENGHNTEKSHGDLRRLAVTQTPVKNRLLKLNGKISQGVNNNNNNSGK